MEGHSVTGDSLYLPLASDADDANIYKENVNTNFTIPVQRAMFFPKVENWEVGLSEIFMPGAIYNIVDEMGVFKVWNKYGYKYYRVPPGMYSANEFVEFVNYLLDQQHVQLAKHDPSKPEDTEPFTTSQQRQLEAEPAGGSEGIHDHFAGEGLVRAEIKRRKQQQTPAAPAPVLKKQRIDIDRSQQQQDVTESQEPLPIRVVEEPSGGEAQEEPDPWARRRQVLRELWERRRRQERDDVVAASFVEHTTGVAVAAEPVAVVAGGSGSDQIGAVTTSNANNSNRFQGRLVYNKHAGKIYFSLVPGEEIRFFDKRMRYMMGFGINDDSAVNVINRNKNAAERTKIGCRSPAQFDAMFQHCYIYCDIVTKSPTAESEIRVLRVLPIEEEQVKQSLIHREYVSPQYHDLSGNTIRDISITIRNDLGYPLPIQRGKVLLVLHFRKKKISRLMED